MTADWKSLGSRYVVIPIASFHVRIEDQGGRHVMTLDVRPAIELAGQILDAAAVARARKLEPNLGDMLDDASKAAKRQVTWLESFGRRLLRRGR